MTNLREVRSVGVVFATNGIAYGLIAPRYPDLVDALDTGPAGLGLVLFAFGAGGVLGSILSPWLLRRFGARRTVRVSMAVLVTGVALPAALPSVAAALVPSFVAGVADASMDVAMNHQGVHAERRFGRSVLQRLHASWTGGLLFGSAIGAAGAGLRVDLFAQLAVGGAVLVGVVLVATRGWVDEPVEDEARVALHRLPAPVLWLGVAGMFGIVLEVIGADWGALWLREDHDFGPGSAGAVALGAYLVFMLIGRMFGDRVVDAVGPDRALIGSCAIATVIPTVGILSGTAAGAVVSLAALGLGAALIFPALLSLSGTLAGDVAAGVAGFSTMSRFGYLVVPLVVGAVAEATTVSTGALAGPIAAAACAGLVAVGTRSGRRRLAAATPPAAPARS